MIHFISCSYLKPQRQRSVQFIVKILIIHLQVRCYKEERQGQGRYSEREGVCMCGGNSGRTHVHAVTIARGHTYVQQQQQEGVYMWQQWEKQTRAREPEMRGQQV